LQDWEFAVTCQEHVMGAHVLVSWSRKD